jgi:hypothetical protein
MNLTDRQLRASILIVIGLVLMAAPEPLLKAFSGSPPLLLAGVSFLSPLGLIFLVIGIYRASTKGKVAPPSQRPADTERRQPPSL